MRGWYVETNSPTINKIRTDCITYKKELAEVGITWSYVYRACTKKNMYTLSKLISALVVIIKEKEHGKMKNEFCAQICEQPKDVFFHNQE